jgi:hypothetical protein
VPDLVHGALLDVRVEQLLGHGETICAGTGESGHQGQRHAPFGPMSVRLPVRKGAAGDVAAAAIIGVMPAMPLLPRLGMGGRLLRLLVRLADSVSDGPGSVAL